MLKVKRKRPQITLKNIHILKDVWGDCAKTNNLTHYLISYYNHWVGGVDVFEKFIS